MALRWGKCFSWAIQLIVLLLVLFLLCILFLQYHYQGLQKVNQNFSALAHSVTPTITLSPVTVWVTPTSTARFTVTSTAKFTVTSTLKVAVIALTTTRRLTSTRTHTLLETVWVTPTLTASPVTLTPTMTVDPVTVTPPAVTLSPSTHFAEAVVVTPTLTAPLPVMITSTITKLITFEQMTSTPTVTWEHKTLDPVLLAHTQDAHALFNCCHLCSNTSFLEASTTDEPEECPPGTYSNESTGECDEILPM